MDLNQTAKRLPHLLLLVFCACGAASPGSAPEKPALPAAPANLGVEQGEVSSVPTGWFVPRYSAERYDAVLTEKDKQSGARAVVLSHKGGGADRFGNLMQSIDAAAYRGRRVRFRGAVRTDGSPGSSAALWLRVDRSGGATGFFDNMNDRPITAVEWREYEIVGEVAADAVSVNFGVMLLGTGKAWFDSASLEVLGEAGAGDEPPRPLEGRALDNLVAFSRLLGCVRFFHPSDEAAAADWNRFAVGAVSAIEPARDAPDLAARLERAFRPLAPTLRVFVTGRGIELPPELLAAAPGKEPPLRKLRWRHFGLGTAQPQLIYSSTRIDDGAALPSRPEPSEPFRADLGGGVSCLVPLDLWADAVGTLPRSAAGAAGAGSEKRPEGWTPSGNDRATRLAAVALAWTVFQHFYPYFDVVESDWPAELERALVSAARDPNERAFLDTLRRLVAALHDGHGRVQHASDVGFSMPPVLWDWIENRLVVTAVAGDAADRLRPGDVVLAVGSVPVEQALAALETRISAATPQWARHRALEDLARGEEGSTLELSVRGVDGAERRVSLTRTQPMWGEQALRESRPEKVAVLEDGIYYVDLGRISDADLSAALEDLARAKGVIFDMRGYPTFNFSTLVAHLTAEPVTSAQWNIPVVERPDREGLEFRFSNWTVAPQSPRLEGRIVFLTDARAISAAETFLGIIEHYDLGTIVGSATAGTNGNINSVILPGGYRVMWTGMQVLKHDGSRHHGVGILPDISVSRTIASVAAGRDELLERALTEIRRGSSSP